jgi:glycosyltransferase involved in cell wall biosynthesis
MKIILFANTDWYLFNYRLPLALTLQEQGHDVLLLSPAGNYFKKILDCGLRWQVFNLSRSGVNPITEITTIFRLVHLYRREKPDLVHNFTIKSVIYSSLAARILGINKSVNSITGMGYIFTRNDIFTIFTRPFVYLLYKIALKNSRVIFQNSSDQKFFTQKHLVNSGQSVIIPGSGVDIKKFKPAQQPDGIPIVVLCARMLWEKGIQEFVDAAEIIKGKGISSRFVLVGMPDKENPLSINEKQLDTWSNSGIVEIWGWHEDMAKIYQGASIACLPSYYREGLAKSLIEAAACGRALVASDIPGCREVIKEGINGLLVPPRQVLPLAQALEKILINSKLRKKMGLESRKIAVSYFSAQKINEATLSEYSKLLANSGESKSDH